MDQFDIPVVLFIYKRIDTTLQIIDRIRSVSPRKIYILSDDGRTPEEKKLVGKCRCAVESSIDWDCEIVKNYADGNRGVYANIGLGAKWVLNREPWAIFLEDDNLPEPTFFAYCKELLQKYKDDDRILWICGTNYLGSYSNSSKHSYMFTHHLLPCGWATWSNKFLEMYDGELSGIEDPNAWKKIKKTYLSKALFRQQKREILSEYSRKIRGERFKSWDYQMNFSVRYNNVLGISPANNQIKNIGVDEFSVHGGTSMQLEMTRRFCGMDSFELVKPLIHPEEITVDSEYERELSKIILQPYRARVYSCLCRFFKKIVGENVYMVLRGEINKIRK